LERWKKKVETRRAEYGDRWRIKPDEYGDLVFVTSMGSPEARYNVESDMRYVTSQRNAIRKNEATKKGTTCKEIDYIHPHCLRHTFATRCFEKGMTARTVQEIMGHSDYNTTISYTHWLEDIKQKEAQKVGNFLDTSIQTDKKVAYENLLGII
jgi:integrase